MEGQFEKIAQVRREPRAPSRVVANGAGFEQVLVQRVQPAGGHTKLHACDSIETRGQERRGPLALEIDAALEPMQVNLVAQRTQLRSQREFVGTWQRHQRVQVAEAGPLRAGRRHQLEREARLSRLLVLRRKASS